MHADACGVGSWAETLLTALQINAVNVVSRKRLYYTNKMFKSYGSIGKGEWYEYKQQWNKKL